MNEIFKIIARKFNNYLEEKEDLSLSEIPDWPFAPRDREWSANNAVGSGGRVRSYVSEQGEGDDIEAWTGEQWNLFRMFHMLYDSDNPEQLGSYALPYGDIVDSEPHIVPQAVFTIAGVLEGAMGGVDVSQEIEDRLRTRVESLYAMMRDEFDDEDIVVPWVDEESSSHTPDNSKGRDDNMEFKFAELEIKQVDEEKGIIEGYASVFSKIDRDNDIVVPGAFSKTIEETDGKVPILHQHDHRKEIGMTEWLQEDDHGLKFRGRLYIKQSDDDDLYVREAQEVYAKLKYRREFDKPLGMSFGFEVGDFEYNDDGVRLLKQIKLWEISPVTFAAQPMATVDNVKDCQDKISLLKKELKEGRVLSQENEQLIREALQALSNILNRLEAEGGDGSGENSNNDIEEDFAEVLEETKGNLLELREEAELFNFKQALKNY